ncbi:MAG: substrate-binding domain-containing protein [Gemmataceae bacterium]
MKRYLFLAAIALVFSGIAGCNSGKSGGVTAGGSDKPKVAVITNCTAEFWSICEAGAKKAGDEFGVEVIFRQPNTNTVTDQMEIVQAVNRVGIKGLAVSVINPKEQTPDLKLIGSKVSLITMDNDAVDSGRMCYVGINNYDAGKAVGRLVKKALPDGGTVALFIGNTTSANAKDRVAGVLDELDGQDNRAAINNGTFKESYGKYKLFRKAPYEDETKEAKAQDNAKEAIEQLKGTPNVCMIGLYAYNPKAILEAARSKQVVGKIKIVGFDEDSVTLDGISKGEIEGTVVQDPFNYGYESVRLLSILAKGGDKSQLPKHPTPYRVVTKNGGPDEKIDGQTISNSKASDYMKKIQDDLKSVAK